MTNRPKTIICDIDGVLFCHEGDITKQHLIEPELLPGVREKIKAWDLEGCTIILVTGRRESTRIHTEVQLAEAGIIHDRLIMGVTGGTRVLINDRKPNSLDDTATAINLERNKGFER
jgi:ribonucleotide monophosphatase NagD (HAD superfamily)